MLHKRLQHNREFVEGRHYEMFQNDKFPAMGLAIVSCMDTRLVEMLPAALGIKNGDAKMIKNAGGMVDDPWGDTMRSILVAIYELKVNHVMIVAHTQCGVLGMDADHMLHLMEERGIPKERIVMLERCDIDLHEWLTGFDDTAEAVAESVDLVRHHPLMPADVEVTGHIMDTCTGEVTQICL